MNEPVKNCPSCGDEFQAWVERCPDCNVPLTIGGENTDAGDTTPEFPPAHQLEKVLVGGPWQTRSLAERLSERGVPCRVDAYPPEAQIDSGADGGSFGQAGHGIDLGVYVKAADLERATEISAELQAEGMPGLDGHEAPEPGTELDACPGCGEPLAADAPGCGECGLEFPEVE
ncbi:MAG: hypothetical protein GY723_19500 [bacterium]|nr:hypothetical protein [bacterium]MCP5070098.1 hypothetical protein [bacterium]